MKCRTKTLVGVLGSVALAAGANALPNTAATPYQSFVERNVFGLKPPPPPAKPPEVPVNVPKITLTGITTILGSKQAMMLVPVPAKPPVPAKEESYILKEGQRDGDIEVLAIDEKAGTVKVKNHGAVQTLDFENNGAKLPTATPLPAVATPNPMIGQAANRAIPTPVGFTFNSALRSGANVTSAGQGAQPGNASGASASVNAAATQPRVTMTPDQQAVIIEAQRAEMIERGDPTAKIMPPTEFTKDVIDNTPPPVMPQ